MKDLDALKAARATGVCSGCRRSPTSGPTAEVCRDAPDAQKIEQAARAGDAETLRQILMQVLSTDTGQRLAGKVKDAMQDG